ncbi:MAG: 2,4-dichlorophenol 6-monooxygenase, partial [Sphingomonadaceae bacterium]
LEAALDVKQTEFNAEGIEMNQRYVSSAIIQDASVPPEEFARNPILYHQPTTRPGAKIPHAWLVDHNGQKRSTLDVTGKGMFCAVTGLAGTAWIEAVARLDLPFLRSVVIDTADSKDLYREWQRIREIEEDGVLLVRPDGYIAWRQVRRPADAAAATMLLGQALESILGITV